MRFTTRMAVLAAAVSLPLGAALASYALAADPAGPRVPPTVRIGERATGQSDGPGSDAPTSDQPTTTTTPPPPPPAPPATEVVPHAPPLSDDDDDDDGGGDDGDSGDDDGDD